MPIIVSNLRTGLDEPERAAIRLAVKKLGVSHAQVKSASVCKKSLDARRRGRESFVLSVAVELHQNESETAQAASDPFVVYRPREPVTFLQGQRRLDAPIIVAGFGPAGIFAAYTLAKNGYPVIVLERGGPLEERVPAVEGFWKNGILDSQTNVQFGEGGAGTFSDGKLTTRISDGLCDWVLQAFAEHGAPLEILTSARPHIGTDRLRGVIRSMREKICKLGGEVRFHTQLTGLSRRNGLLIVRTETGELSAGAVVLAVGHSARDTFSLLAQEQICMEAKSFSVGVRIEQLQSVIDRGLYGDLAGDPRLPKGEYQLSWRQGTRAVYTFCMCPGGYVVPAASEQGGVVTNGMSEQARDGKNANAALVVSVGPEDFGSSPLSGMEFQRKLEQQAFLAGGSSYRAPAATVGEYLAGKAGCTIGRVQPTYAAGITPFALSKLFLPEVDSMLREGLVRFERKLPGFGAADGILTGVESRTSSPVRILRQAESLQSPSMEGLYPCGEGAGYAGGIMSAAVDGIRVAQKIIGEYAPALESC